MSEVIKRVSVIGLGYIGLPTAAALARAGAEVIGVDVNQSVVDTINEGKAHIVEPDLDALVQSQVAAGRLRATTEVEQTQVYLIAVPTPFMEDRVPDVKYIRAAARSLAPKLKKGALIVLESTSPVGTAENLAAWLAEERPDLCFPNKENDNDGPDIHIAYCPERVLPGNTLRELVENDRLIGGLTATCAVRAASLYRLFVKGELIITDARTAEMAKLTENAYRDVNIAFANELSIICDRLHIDVWELVRLANHHPRVNILNPGPGVGGHCIAVDPWFIVDAAPEEARLIKTAREVNDAKPEHVVAKVTETIYALGRKGTVACLGLAYKADIDDLRESPALDITTRLAGMGTATILAVEPHIDKLPPVLTSYKDVRLASLETALVEADIILVLVDHSAFRNVDRGLLADKIIIDTRGIWR